MSIDETRKLLALIVGTYPKFEMYGTSTTDAWHHFLQNEDYDTVCKRFDAWANGRHKAAPQVMDLLHEPKSVYSAADTPKTWKKIHIGDHGRVYDEDGYEYAMPDEEDNAAWVAQIRNGSIKEIYR